MDIAPFRNALSFDRSTGEFRWLDSGPRRVAGAIAGCRRRDGYVRVKVGKNVAYAHRLAWAFEYGAPAPTLIDHINGDPSDNRIANLRSATARMNSQNRRSPCRGAPLLGAHQDKHWGGWTSAISVAGKQKHLGRFKTAEEAHAAYIEAKKIYHPGYVV